MRLGETGRADPAADRARVGEPVVLAEAGSRPADIRTVRGCAFGESAPLSHKRQTGRAPTAPGAPVIPGGSFLIALLCGTLPAPHGPGGSTAGGEGKVARDAPRRPRSARPPRKRRRPGSPRGNPGCGSSPRQGSFGAGGRSGKGRRGPTAVGRPGARRGRALTCSWRWAARGAWAEGRRGTALRRPGPAAPAPRDRARGAGAVSAATFCARRARPAGRIRSAGRASAGRLRAARARPKAGGSGAARRPHPRSAAAPCGFSLPLLLFRPVLPRFSRSVTHRSPRVPPSLFHFPLRNVTLAPPRLSPVLLLLGRGLWGVKGL